MGSEAKWHVTTLVTQEPPRATAGCLARYVRPYLRFLQVSCAVQPGSGVLSGRDEGKRIYPPASFLALVSPWVTFAPREFAPRHSRIALSGPLAGCPRGRADPAPRGTASSNPGRAERTQTPGGWLVGRAAGTAGRGSRSFCLTRFPTCESRRHPQLPSLRLCLPSVARTRQAFCHFQLLRIL